MQVTIPYIVHLRADFTNPRRYVFKKDQIGTYGIDLEQLQRQLLDEFRTLQAQGWSVQTVVPIQGGVYHYDTKTGGAGTTGAWGWGYGWGTSATEGLLLILTRPLDDQIATRWLEALPAFRAYREAVKLANPEYRAKRVSEVMERLGTMKSIVPRSVKRSMLGFGKAQAFSFLDVEYETEAEAYSAKAIEIANIERELLILQAPAPGVAIERYLREDQVAILQHVMPDGNLRSECYNEFAAWLMPNVSPPRAAAS